ncbi:hypothetical protein PV05_11411 [Exophiala xenobiotica]|uniref:Tr-type G domain-containing protein n=1 Tax=Exophiala xenobiotica TaxID=348802 RepID=A0A0D2CIM9_9EURO|nr:uncharacterized protein PV05_11411 [Exophiala xenobiotica]KIW49762.1 hypothetical protein PV05_11411 [Exophiala xenobiotica]
MASIFTYQDEPPRIHSPWSTPGTSTPQPSQSLESPAKERLHYTPDCTKLEPERHDGPTEYKLHLLLRPRRKFVSTSTASSTSGPPYTLAQSAVGPNRSFGETPLERRSVQPSGQARQLRLQQLTTQLLWRLQQSSPFHSSSNADLVLPVLPEATPKLGVPERPAKLLPGLEESQGALYEIGVADDGTLVGLTEEELQESLTNLSAMAASLGCTTNVLRKVTVGTCEWMETESESDKGRLQRDKLSVAEVLVYPDSRASSDADVPKETLNPSTSDADGVGTQDVVEKASTEQLRVTLVGAASSGKSTLLGTLSTSTLDNGRGKSRLSLLKHRHEIASGITSSVAQELVGYETDRARPNPVVNYASGDVSSWTDIQNLADRLVFLCDSPGLPRFAKSTFRSLISWKPSWTILCVAADENEENTGRIGATVSAAGTATDSRPPETVDLSLSHLDMCLRLELPLMIVITKMDLANKSGLRSVLAKLLSTLKAAEKVPVMMANTLVPAAMAEGTGSLLELQFISAKDQVEVDLLGASMRGNDGSRIVPILMASAVTGQGVTKLHALLRSLPISQWSRPKLPATNDSSESFALFHVDEVFSIPPSRVYTLNPDIRLAKQGVVLCGHVSHGVLSVGNVLYLGPFGVDTEQSLPQTSRPILRSKSYCAEQPDLEKRTGIVARSYQESSKIAAGGAQMTPTYLRVRVVSLRNLRLPVNRMREGETGTIGVEPAGDQSNSLGLGKARKGMVLIDTKEIPGGYSSFSAGFPSSDFSHTNSPPLLLGGHAIIYVNSVRAAVKVTLVDLEEDERTRHGSLTREGEVFSFDSDDETERLENLQLNGGEKTEIKITFRFVSSVEWMNVGDQVLVVPTVSAAGPVTGVAVSNLSGLAGFVGKVSEVFAA